jgi:hypothetical protein
MSCHICIICQVAVVQAAIVRDAICQIYVEPYFSLHMETIAKLCEKNDAPLHNKKKVFKKLEFMVLK